MVIDTRDREETIEIGIVVAEALALNPAMTEIERSMTETTISEETETIADLLIEKDKAILGGIDSHILTKSSY